MTSETLTCPVCRGRTCPTRDTLERHITEDHPPQSIAAELIYRVYPPQPDACSKRKYPSQSAAFSALISAALGSARSQNRAEKRAYHCPRCGGWHLTKSDERTAP